MNFKMKDVFIPTLLVGQIFYSLMTHAAGVVVLAGGGPEGDIGDKQAWSYDLYKRLVDNGDINGDKKIKVVILSSEKPETDFMVNYFKSLGATTAENVVVSNRKQANDSKIVSVMKDADVVFIRGGDQGEYYRNWKNTKVQAYIHNIDQKGGALGGTSAGAMSMAQYALAGGQDLVSKDPLLDSRSKLLDDQRGGSSIHNDFIGAVPDAIIDTHFGERARLGRLMGVHAKASEDFNRKDLLGIGITEKTGVAISKGAAQVYGGGTVEFIQQTSETRSIRQKGKPLVYTNIRDDVLSEGMTYDLKQKKPNLSKVPPELAPPSQKKKCGTMVGNVKILGSDKNENQKFEYSPRYGQDSYQLIQIRPHDEQIKGVIGLTKALSDEDDPSGGTIKSKIHAAAYQALVENPGRTVFLIPDETAIENSTPHKENTIVFKKNHTQKGSEASTMILDCSECTYVGMTNKISNMDNGSRTLKTPAMINMRVDIIGNSIENNLSYNLKTHRISRQTDLQDKNCEFKPLNSEHSLKKTANAITTKLDECEP